MMSQSFTKMNRKWIGIATLAGLLFPLAVLAEAPVRSSISILFRSGLSDVHGNRPNASTDPSTLLYKAVNGQPLLAPDGHQLTWGEWIEPLRTDTSRVSVKCVDKGTHVVIEATGLIPNALYSAWLFAQATPTSMFAVGTLRSVLPGDNSFVTDETGAGSFNAIVPAGPLSIQGEVSDCLLTSSTFIIQLDYHSDGRLYGGVPGPAVVTFGHIAFIFNQ
jgi:hypothetical protein